MARTRAATQYPFGRTSLDPPGSVLLEITATLNPTAARVDAAIVRVDEPWCNASGSQTAHNST
jgi:hypothetical protein